MAASIQFKILVGVVSKKDPDTIWNIEMNHYLVCETLTCFFSEIFRVFSYSIKIHLNGHLQYAILLFDLYNIGFQWYTVIKTHTTDKLMINNIMMY